MAKTYEIAVPAATWTQLSAGETNVLVQCRTGSFYIAVSDTEPDVNDRVGHNVDSGEPSISFGSLLAANKVWAYSSTDNVLVVTK